MKRLKTNAPSPHRSSYSSEKIQFDFPSTFAITVDALRCHTPTHGGHAKCETPGKKTAEARGACRVIEMQLNHVGETTLTDTSTEAADDDEFMHLSSPDHQAFVAQRADSASTIGDESDGMLFTSPPLLRKTKVVPIQTTPEKIGDKQDPMSGRSPFELHHKPPTSKGSPQASNPFHSLTPFPKEKQRKDKELSPPGHSMISTAKSSDSFESHSTCDSMNECFMSEATDQTIADGNVDFLRRGSVTGFTGSPIAEERESFQLKAPALISRKLSPDQRISPTDVSSFPLNTPLFGMDSDYYERATPNRSPTMPPATPFKARTHGTPERPLISRRGRDDSTASKLSPRSNISRFSSDFQIMGTVGMGAFGTVYKCLSKLDGCTYAIKAAKRAARGLSELDKMLKEVYALAALSDIGESAAFHIVRYHQAWMEDNRLYIQTELCTSTLSQEMAASGLDLKRKFKLLREMLLALELIHRKGMVHLDIKPDNIFIKDDKFKLGDFGLVSKIASSNDIDEGDSRYMSKELLAGDYQDLKKSDIFSLGATLYEVCIGRSLPANGEEWHDIRSGKFAPLPNTPFEMKIIVIEMMNPLSLFRPEAEALLKKPHLMSDEQQQLIMERNKVAVANMALAAEQKRLKALQPPKPVGKLVRRTTWDVDMMMKQQ